MIFLRAFLTGGFLCLIGQILLDKTKLTPPVILVGYVITGIILGALGIYPKIIEFASSGAAVPLSGFGSLLAAGTKEAVDKYGLLGAFYGPMTAGSAGITGAVVSAFIVSLFAKPKTK